MRVYTILQITFVVGGKSNIHPSNQKKNSWTVTKKKIHGQNRI